ncbi:MAG TPA: hypothetical protein VJN18_09225 [Polyangiaceae bacterium]|nr:hypothetical protein [Polyangiaceae bacterium]
MPLSSPDHLPAVLHFIRSLQPRSILDVGVGTGSYGLLLRQYLDIGQLRIRPEEWVVRIDGVEIFEGYRNPVWDFAYDNVYVGDVRQLESELCDYGVVLCNDVLEHFPRAEVRALVRALLDKCQVLIATSPSSEYPQGPWGGNEAEAHHCLINAADFEGLVATVKAVETTCYVCTPRRDLVLPLLRIADDCARMRDPVGAAGTIRWLQRSLRRLRVLQQARFQ